jgi:hypothetical protein
MASSFVDRFPFNRGARNEVRRFGTDKGNIGVVRWGAGTA